MAPAAAADGYILPAVLGGGAKAQEDSANEVSSEGSGKERTPSDCSEPLQPDALDKGKGKMVQGRRTDSASSLRCAQHPGTCRDQY